MFLLEGKSGVRNNIVEKVISEDKAVVNAIMVAKEFVRSDFVYASRESNSRRTSVVGWPGRSAVVELKAVRAEKVDLERWAR